MRSRQSAHVKTRVRCILVEFFKLGMLDGMSSAPQGEAHASTGLCKRAASIHQRTCPPVDRSVSQSVSLTAYLPTLPQHSRHSSSNQLMSDPDPCTFPRLSQ